MVQQKLIEKEKEIQKLQESQAEKEEMANKMKAMFEKERYMRELQMQELMDAFKKQQEAIIDRLSSMPARNVILLDQEKEQARKIYEEKTGDVSGKHYDAEEAQRRAQ